MDIRMRSGLVRAIAWLAMAALGSFCATYAGAAIILVSKGQITTGSDTRGNLGGGLGNPVRHQSLSNWRAMTRRWISLVPSPMVQSFTSR